MSAVLAINAGSSSLKFALFGTDAAPLARGEVERLGLAANFTTQVGAARQARDVVAASLPQALDVALDWIARRYGDLEIAAVAHRVVHGGTRYAAPVVLDDAVLRELEGFDPLAPQHQPFNLAAARALRLRFPNALPVACFDTAFHATWSDSAQRLPLPRRLHDAGVRRYGFHGLSYEYLSARVRELAPQASRVILAHLGSGASVCAVRDGRSVDATMGFSTLGGLPMATRCGEIDPGVIFHLQRAHGMSVADIERLMYHDSGLRGMSGIGGDLRALLADAGVAARQAIDVFVQRCTQAIGAMAATLGGVDALVFSGGIGAHAPAVRAMICAPLGFLGIELDAAANAHNADAIGAAHVPVYALVTDEERVLAQHALALLTRQRGGLRVAESES